MADGKYMKNDYNILNDYSECCLSELLKSATPVPFSMQKSVRTVDHLDITSDLASLIKDSTEFPFNDANSEEYHQYTHPVLLMEVDKTMKFTYCYADRSTPIFVRKAIRAFRYVGYRYIQIEYLLYCFSRRFLYSNLSTCKYFFVDPENLRFGGYNCLHMRIKYPSRQKQRQITDGILDMQSCSSNSLPIGIYLNEKKYLIKGKLGNGGFALTYLATIDNPESPNHGKEVAIKEFFMKEFCYRDPQTLRITYTTTDDGEQLVLAAHNKFIGEIEKIRMCNHPNIIRIFDSFSENNTYYYVMEYISGGSLADRMIEKGTGFSEKEALWYIRGVAHALKEMHGMHLLHLDVKPSNILVRPTGEPVLIDFGATKRYEPCGYACTRNPLIRTLWFQSPEQRLGLLGTFLPEADVYSLAVTFYYLLNNCFPRCGNRKWGKTSRNIREALDLALTSKKEMRLKTIDDFLKVLDEGAPLSIEKDFPQVPQKRGYEESGFF